VAYVEDLMDEQVRQGHEVSYLFSGRLYPLPRGPRLRRWRQRGVTMLELVNSPLYDHGRQPLLELSEPRVEEIVERTLRELRPDVMHVQELAGLPSSILEIGRTAGVPVVLTLQDYFPLCPAFKLLDSRGQVCLRRDVGEDCVATLALDTRDHTLLYKATLSYHLDAMPVLGRLNSNRRLALGNRLAKWYTRAAPRQNGSARDPAAFQRRRDLNVDRLNHADRLIAMSSRVAEIYAQLGVDESRLHTAQLTLAHIEHLRPRTYAGNGTVTFATLGGGESEAKGSRLLLDAMRLLRDQVDAGRVRLVIFGYSNPEVMDEVGRLPGVELAGPYRPDELDARLDQVDVGLMPSIWEEAYGYAGIEFLAKGIPVIANAIGGMVDYVRDGQTGWLNHDCTPESLAAIMRTIAERPEQIADLNHKLVAAHDSIVMPLSRHAAEMDAIYREVIGAR